MPSRRELANAIRSANGTVPVIFMSGYTADVILDRGLLDGEVTILQKPFTARSLSTQLQESLAETPSAPSASQ